MRVRKRDGSLQPFEVNKIKRCLLMAFDSCDVEADVMPLVHMITDRLVQRKIETVAVYDIQITVEEALDDCGFALVSEHYRDYRIKRDRIRQQRLTPDPEVLKEFIFRSKYAWKGGETWEQCIKRTLEMHLQKFSHLDSSIKMEIVDAFDKVLEKEVLPSMRSLQFGGDAVRAHNARMYNCSYTAINRPDAFSEILYLLLCGCGVGFSVRWHDIEELPALKYIDKRLVTHFTIPDSIEGWADAVKLLFCGYEDGVYIEFDYSEIRHQGAELKTSGGVAPGHLGLKATLESVRSVLDKAQGRKLRPIEVHDIICHIAQCVVSGGIRRSSLISLFSPGDLEMMYAKTPGCFDPRTGLNAQRALCNNTVVFNPDVVKLEDIKRVITISQDYGEPGFAFLSDNEGINPCGEIILTPYEFGFGFCNLVEVFAGAKDLIEAVKAATIIATLQATYTSFGYLGSASKTGAEADALIGVSITGLLDYPERFSREVFKELRKTVQETNKIWAERLGINPAKRCTCIKPSGTASLLLGCSNGIHPRYARRYFRRVIVADDDAVAQRFIEHNPHMLEVSDSGKRWLVFPVQAPDTSIILRDLTANEHLDLIDQALDYVDHSISCTVVVKPEEMEDVIAQIYMSRYDLRTLSFSPPILETKYPHAPFEAITDTVGEARWNMLIENHRPVNWDGLGRNGVGVACEGMACEL